MRLRMLLLSMAVMPLLALTAEQSECVSIHVEGQDLVTYQARPMTDHYRGDAFRGSNFIHPLKTPSGFVVTESAPTTDHPHHFGLWWPWKHIEVDGRKILCWELQQGDGIVEARGARRIPNGLIGESVYIDRKAPGGPVERLKETTRMTVSEVVDSPAIGYSLDVVITQQCADATPVIVTPYRYSGFSIRGTPAWKEHSTYLTSEGKQRIGSNNTPARWVRIEGTSDGAHAGILMMSHPTNQGHPEYIRTWEKGRAFVNFNTVTKEPWHIEPGQSYTRQYRLFVYDGAISAAQAEALWKDYATDASI